MKYNTTFEVMSEIYKVISGDYTDNISKYDVAIKILNIVEDYEASEHTGKDPKNVTMNLFSYGDNNHYYTFDGVINNGDFLEGNIKISGVIPAGNYKAFVINDEIAAILIGTNFSGQSISLKRENLFGKEIWISK